MDFEYLSNIPVLTIDVNEDFKASDQKGADMIEKVSGFKYYAEMWCIKHYVWIIGEFILKVLRICTYLEKIYRKTKKLQFCKGLYSS